MKYGRNIYDSHIFLYKLQTLDTFRYKLRFGIKFDCLILLLNKTRLILKKIIYKFEIKRTTDGFFHKYFFHLKRKTCY